MRSRYLWLFIIANAAYYTACDEPPSGPSKTELDPDDPTAVENPPAEDNSGFASCLVQQGLTIL
jgi:hypothetical protein